MFRDDVKETSCSFHVETASIFITQFQKPFPLPSTVKCIIARQRNDTINEREFIF